MGSLRLHPYVLWLVGAAVLIAACRKESDRARWDVDLLAPLVTTTLDIGDLLADSLVSVGPGGQVSLLYQSELFALDLDTVLNAPDTSFPYRFALPIPGPLNFPAGSSPVVEDQVTRFDLDDVSLRYLELREGWLDLEVTNMIASMVIGTFSLPGATLPTGSAVLSTAVAAGTPAAPSYSTVSQDLAGATFDLRGPDLDEVNTLATNFTAQLDPNGNGATLTNMDSLNALATYRGLVPQYARGYFGSRTTTSGPTSNPISLFENVVGGSLDLDQVSLRFKVQNGIGMDIQVRLRELSAINSRTGATVDLTHSILQGPVNLDRALDLGNGFQPSFYANELDNSDSNIDAFLENLPDSIRYKVELYLNPLGDISNGHDFVYHDSRLRADLELEIPLRLIANELTLQTFAEVDLPGNADGHGLQNGTLKLFATNGFPFSARLELAIVDEAGNVLSEVPVSGLIASGILSPFNVVSQPVASELQAHLDRDQVDQLYAGGRFRIRSVFNTADQNQHLQIYSHYRLDLQVTMQANYLVNGDE